MPVAEICRRVGISQATYFNWKKKYDGLLPTEMRRLKQFEDENGRLRKEVYGTKATAIVDLSHPGRTIVRLSLKNDKTSNGGWIDLPVRGDATSFGEMIQSFIECVAAAKAPVTVGIDGLLTVAIADAAHQSQNTG